MTDEGFELRTEGLAGFLTALALTLKACDSIVTLPRY